MGSSLIGLDSFSLYQLNTKLQAQIGRKFLGKISRTVHSFRSMVYVSITVQIYFFYLFFLFLIESLFPLILHNILCTIDVCAYICIFIELWRQRAVSPTMCNPSMLKRKIMYSISRSIIMPLVRGFSCHPVIPNIPKSLWIRGWMAGNWRQFGFRGCCAESTLFACECMTCEFRGQLCEEDGEFIQFSFFRICETDIISKS